MRLAVKAFGGVGMIDITYTKHDDYYLPDLVLPEQETVSFGKYGMLCNSYLKNHRKIFYTNLLTSDKLNQYLADINKQAKDMVETLTKQMVERQGVTEELKAQDQMAWVGAMDNIRACAEEIVLKEIVYC